MALERRSRIVQGLVARAAGLNSPGVHSYGNAEFLVLLLNGYHTFIFVKLLALESFSRIALQDLIPQRFNPCSGASTALCEGHQRCKQAALQFLHRRRFLASITTSQAQFSIIIIIKARRINEMKEINQNLGTNNQTPLPLPTALSATVTPKHHIYNRPTMKVISVMLVTAFGTLTSTMSTVYGM